MRRHRWEKKQQETARRQRDEAKAANQHKPAEPKVAPSASLRAASVTIDLSACMSAIERQLLALSALFPPPSDLPSRVQAEPITAWKRARVCLTDQGPVLRGVVHGTYKPVDVAKHVNDGYFYSLYAGGVVSGVSVPPAATAGHEAPRKDCTCGFYGVSIP